MSHVSNMTCLMHVKKSVCAKYIIQVFALNLSMFQRMLAPPHLDLYVYMYVYTRMSPLESEFLILNIIVLRILHACHVTCM